MITNRNNTSAFARRCSLYVTSIFFWILICIWISKKTKNGLTCFMTRFETWWKCVSARRCFCVFRAVYRECSMVKKNLYCMRYPHNEKQWWNHLIKEYNSTHTEKQKKEKKHHTSQRPSHRLTVSSRGFWVNSEKFGKHPTQQWKSSHRTWKIFFRNRWDVWENEWG